MEISQVGGKGSANVITISNKGKIASRMPVIHRERKKCNEKNGSLYDIVNSKTKSLTSPLTK